MKYVEGSFTTYVVQRVERFGDAEAERLRVASFPDGLLRGLATVPATC